MSKNEKVDFKKFDKTNKEKTKNKNSGAFIKKGGNRTHNGRPF